MPFMSSRNCSKKRKFNVIILLLIKTRKIMIIIKSVFFLNEFDSYDVINTYLQSGVNDSLSLDNGGRDACRVI